MRLQRRSRQSKPLAWTLAGAMACGMSMAHGAEPVQAVVSSQPPVPVAERQASSGNEALDNAVAAVVVSALTEQLGNQAIAVRLDSIDVRISSLRDRIVSGEGRMRVGDDPDWIGFRYRTVYDTTFGSAGYPELTIGGVGAGEREVPNDASLVTQLDARITTELDKQFGTGSARLQLDRITTVEAGRRFLRISATGMADFGLNGTTPIRIESLYDTARSAWLRVDYGLGASP